MPDKTLFEKILDGELPADLVWQDDHCGAFRDINPQAPTHVLIVPRKPLPGIADMTEDDRALLGHLYFVATEIARREGLEHGYRLVVNQGEHGQQTVPHLHVHLIGGRPLGWPPG